MVREPIHRAGTIDELSGLWNGECRPLAGARSAAERDPGRAGADLAPKGDGRIVRGFGWFPNRVSPPSSWANGWLGHRRGQLDLGAGVLPDPSGGEKNEKAKTNPHSLGPARLIGEEGARQSSGESQRSIRGGRRLGVPRLTLQDG